MNSEKLFFWALWRVLLIGTIFAPAGVILGQNLISNPGFETAPAQGGQTDLQNAGANTVYWGPNFTAQSGAGSTITSNSWTFGFTGTASLTGRGASEVEWFTSAAAQNWNPTPPHGGTYAVELNTDNATASMYAKPTLSSNIVAGKSYTLSFWVAPEIVWNAASGVSSIEYRVTIGGTSSVLLTGTIDAPALLVSSTWTHVSFTFISGTTTNDIRFWDGVLIGGTNSNYSSVFRYSNDVSFDDFSLSETPEPQTYAAEFLLLCVVGWVERKRLESLASRATALFKKAD